MFKDGRQRLDDLAGIAGGAFSMMSGLRAEVEAMVRAQVEALVQRLELARAEEVEAAMEVARRARAEIEALQLRVAELEAMRPSPPDANPASAPEL